MADPTTDTIVALSSGALPAGVAVLRVSGPHVRFVLETMCGEVPEPRTTALRSIRNRNGEMLDKGLVIYFQSPKSFTGEDCAEFQVHGGRAIVAALLSELAGLPNIRLAEPGEFTRRAFENGRMDLTEAEGLADLIAAQTEMQRRLAVAQADGGLTRLYAGWAHQLLHARALVEADLDFADEDDVPGSVADRVWSDLEALRDEMERHLAYAAIGERIRDGFKIVIVGPPNAGKSSLLNALASREVAIVSPEAGTTRDLISVDVDLGGYAASITDTAGIRATDHGIEREGIARAKKALMNADLVLNLSDNGAYIDDAPENIPHIYVGTKSDLIDNRSIKSDIAISVETGQGVDGLIALCKSKLSELANAPSMALPTRLRHRQHLTESLDYLERAVTGPGMPIELRSEDLRMSADALGRITGRVDVEDVLDVIFSSFCIGK
ncbi:tRNA uridine-5-carboxymethylaminomethyl(34) synthesis GTPase MnmE [Rhizobium sp. EC-SD404]|uniref:tRNA uridine-5-carboxymethylaminomethyl(34) synthesis GTPase MnmE n=1 Tax=Rhizobium sp. EC-SD404 TaxID=2038389 RepID=UPI001259D6D4|nr:tRNA uridine-5-carboxymethylaminomethyl(34) synthesis GTPase MnmE [Rhizobium sp. EC-SD404]VVS99660.1 tRNA modification GTPase MnmE [Rhizobium sp. EC-SD404]